MLFRLYNVEENTLFIDGYDIMHLPVKLVRDVIGYCPQDNFLFSDTVRSNIAFSNPEIEQSKVEEAAEFACVKANIEDFSNQYDTLIGEGGVNLSGGQKQRIAIARTLLKDTKVILFDEATSALDNTSQEYIKKTIDDLVKTHTIIIVAHRLSTIMDADLIYVVEDGKAEMSGTHEELMEKSTLYKQLYSPEVLDF